jgi:hypothetical protein
MQLPARELVRFTRWQSKSVVSQARNFPATSRAAPVPLPGGESNRLGYVNRLPGASSAVSNDMYAHIHGMVLASITHRARIHFSAAIAAAIYQNVCM